MGLMKAFKDDESRLVADVDCTAAGKPLCDQVGVRGYPTIKHGDPNNLEDYKGGRDFAALEKFAKGLKPVCSPAKMEKAEKYFTDEVDKLQKAYQKLQEDKESTINAVKESGLGLMKSVKASAGKAEL